MAHRYSLARPHPRHVPSVHRVAAGNPSRRNGGTRQGTRLECTCYSGARWYNYGLAPSAGGRSWAGATYRNHLADTAPQVELTRAQLEVLQLVHAAGHLPTTVHTTGRAVAGNVAAALVRKGLLRNLFTPWAPGAPPTEFKGVEATAAGCAVLAQYATWGWPK